MALFLFEWFCSFLCTTFSSDSHYLGSDEDNKGNPFVSLMGEGLWATGGTDPQLRLSDLQPIISEVSERDRISKTQARQNILSRFTEYYLEHLCKPVCKYHSGSNNYLIYSLTSQKECTICKERTSLVPNRKVNNHGFNDRHYKGKTKTQV